MLEDYQPPTLGQRLTHPFAISALLGLALVGAFVGWRAWTEYQRKALDEELRPHIERWQAQRREVTGEMAVLLAKLPDAGASPVAARCGDLGVSSIEVVHRPLLAAIAEDEPRRDGTGPAWLNSLALRYLAGDTTPGRDVEQHEIRRAAVRGLADAPVIAVLETTTAEHPEIIGEQRFDGGNVSGRLLIIHVADGSVACAAAIHSAPMFAITLKQDDPGAQAFSDRRAVDNAAHSAYWEAVDDTLGTLSPELAAAPH